MLQLACGICLGVNVGYLLHLQASLKRCRVVDTSSHEEDILCVRVFCRKPLQSFLISEYLAYLVGYCLKLCDILRVFPVIYKPPDRSELNGERIAYDQLGTVSLGSSDGYLGPCKSIEHMVSLFCYGGAYHIYYGKGLRASSLCFPECCE